jgi:murein DD-endopeptidase MepM/ murein hydrolase activator NlpD
VGRGAIPASYGAVRGFVTRELLDHLIGLGAGALLLTLLAAATLGTAQRAQGQPLPGDGLAATAVEEATPLATAEPGGTMVAAAEAAPSSTPRSRATRRPTRTPTLAPSPTATRTPRPTRTPRATRSPTVEVSITAEVTAGPSETPTPRPSPTRSTPPTPAATTHFWLRRPIGPEHEDGVAHFYPYGSTGENTLQIHHGVEFVNPQGTQVYAAGSGTVLFARSDDEIAVGPNTVFYGNVVVVQLDQKWLGQAVLNLYGHLDEIQVKEGQHVEAGDKIGLVGMTGIALGPHLHFEVRIGANAYSATRNPELWFPPHEGNGTIVGRVLDANGERVPLTLVTLQRPDEKVYRRASSYPNTNVNSDEELDENLVLGDVPAGRWVVAARINGSVVIDEVTVRAGELAWVHLQEKAD